MNNIINKRNGILAAVVAVVVIGAVIVTTSLSQAMSLDEAKDIAAKYVPASAKFLTSEEEDGKFEVLFRDDAKKESYEVEVSKETKKVKKVGTQLDMDLGSKTVKLKENDVKEIVKKSFDGVTSINVSLNKDDGLYEYNVTFKSNTFYGNADIHPVNGQILESTIKYGTAATIPLEGNNKEGLLTYPEVKKAVIAEAGGGTIKDIDLEKEQGSYYYEVELIKDGLEYQYRVDAKSGKITLDNKHDSHMDTDGTTGATQKEDSNDDNNTSSTTNNDSGNKISTSKAKSIVLNKIPGAKIIKINLEREDGRYVYDGKATLKGYEYEFEINASSGVITSWDKDKIDRHDDNDNDNDNDNDDDHDDD